MNFADMRFLVVDENDATRWNVVTTLCRMGATHVTPAREGRPALRILRDEDSRIDVVIADVDLPDMDGMRFIRELAQFPRCSVILATAFDAKLVKSMARVARGHGVNVEATMAKPLDMKELEGTLHALLRAPAALTA